MAALGTACQSHTISDGPQSNSIPATQPGISAGTALATAPEIGDPALEPNLDPLVARQLRRKLVAQIAASKELHGESVLQALRDVPRHLFTNNAALELSYADHPLPIGYEQTISQPTIVAIMTEALELTGKERVLEIGTGSGYQAAVLSALSREVYSVELIDALGQAAKPRLAHLGYRNVEVRVGDGYQGWPEKAPFDRILLTAAPPNVPQALLDELSDKGVLVAPIGPVHGEQSLYRFRKVNGSIEKEGLGAVRFVPMISGKTGQ